MVDQRRLVGNDIRAVPRGAPLRRPGPGLATSLDRLTQRRQQLIELAAAPPSIPVPARVTPLVPTTTPAFNQLAYNVLLVSMLAAVSALSGLTNAAFLVYGIVVIIVRLPSVQLFGAALISLVILPVVTTLQKATLADVFATMTFYFLVIGLVRAGLELRREGKNKAKLLKR